MFPKRGALAAFLTMLALVAILAYQTPSTTPPPDNGALFDSPAAEASAIAFEDPTASNMPSADPTATESPTGTASWPASPATEPSPAPAGAGAPGTTRPTAAPPNSTPKPPAPPARTAAPGFTGKVNGTVQYIEFGPMQVQAVFSGGRLTNVVALKTPNSDSRSVQIAQRAVPILRSEALAAQSARIHTVSGATYTSQAYIASLQSALDKKP